jgi:hypothetical protein
MIAAHIANATQNNIGLLSATNNCHNAAKKYGVIAKRPITSATAEPLDFQLLMSKDYFHNLKYPQSRNTPS